MVNTDIKQAVSLMKTALMNIFESFDSKDETEVIIGFDISENLLNKCLYEANWKKDQRYHNVYITPEGNYVMILPDRIILV